MDLVGKDDLLELYMLLAEALDEICSLTEVDVTIVVGMQQEHRRLPL